MECTKCGRDAVMHAAYSGSHLCETHFLESVERLGPGVDVPVVGGVDTLCDMTIRGFQGNGSPDRVDALVWALHELILAQTPKPAAPRMRVL